MWQADKGIMVTDSTYMRPAQADLFKAHRAIQTQPSHDTDNQLIQLLLFVFLCAMQNWAANNAAKLDHFRSIGWWLVSDHCTQNSSIALEDTAIRSIDQCCTLTQLPASPDATSPNATSPNDATSPNATSPNDVVYVTSPNAASLNATLSDATSPNATAAQAQ
jgi:hypothetical protein